jgi:hypothetical protein
MDASKGLEDNTLDSQTVLNRKAGHFSSFRRDLPLLMTHGEEMERPVRDQGNHPVARHRAKAHQDGDRVA